MKITFPNDLTIEAPDATGILEGLALVQPDHVKGAEQMKRVLTVRADALGGTLDPTLPDALFLAAADKAGLFTLDASSITFKQPL